MAKKNRKKTNSFSNPKDAPCPFPFDSYELQREGTLITQAGLITAVFSFSTTALFAVWQVGLAELERIPDMWVHLCMGFITFLLLLSMFAAVTCLHKAINTNRKKGLSISDIRKNNNSIVKRIKIAVYLFEFSMLSVFVCAIALGVKYYFPILCDLCCHG